MFIKNPINAWSLLCILCRNNILIHNITNILLLILLPTTSKMRYFSRVSFTHKYCAHVRFYHFIAGKTACNVNGLFLAPIFIEILFSADSIVQYICLSKVLFYCLNKHLKNAEISDPSMLEHWLFLCLNMMQNV